MKMKKFFENPSMSISKFNMENVVTVSVADATAPTSEGTDYAAAYGHIQGKVGNDARIVKITF